MGCAPFTKYRAVCPLYSPSAPHVLMDFVVFPPRHGRSVTDFWGWDAHEARLGCPDDVSGDIGGCSARRALKPKGPLYSGIKIFCICPQTVPWVPYASNNKQCYLSLCSMNRLMFVFGTGYVFCEARTDINVLYFCRLYAEYLQLNTWNKPLLSGI